jgi:hypothetical protein
MNTTTLQQILGPGKDGNLLSIHISPDRPDDLHVYFGLAYLEKVKNRQDGFQYKYLLARLYNTGYKRKTLHETFGHAISTLQRWGDAVKSGEIDKILKAFIGQGAGRIMTEEIESFIRSEFQRIYPENKYTYSSEILGRVAEVFKVEFSSERLRNIFAEEKRKRGILLSSTETTLDLPIRSKACDLEVIPGSKELNNRNYSLSKSSEEDTKTSYVHHLGIVLAFWMYKELGVEDKIIEQWLSCILLGKVNFEQTESLDFDSLDFLHGYTLLRKAKTHHIVLRNYALEENNVYELFQKNVYFLGGQCCQYYYYDPHSIKYTGMKNILKGWCGSAGKITKVNYQDFFHTPSGYPVYFEIHDNSIDMRERFIKSVKNFTSKITTGKKKTFIIDRGIYGKEKMQLISESGYGLVTWEKGYKTVTWDEKAEVTSFNIIRPKNHSADIKTWKVKFIKETSYCKVPGFYRLVVRITAPRKNSKEAEVSILSNGKINDETAVFAMLNRWVQENDFRYMVLYFGLNQITSYKVKQYNNTEILLAEKQIKSDAYKLIGKAIKSKTDAFSKALKNLAKKAEGKNLEMTTEILKLKNEIKCLEKERSGIKAYENKLEKLIRDKTSKLATDKKYMLDVVKITARNMFFTLLKIFRPIYNNYRNDHTILRELIRAHGYIRSKDNKINLLLDLERRVAVQQKTKIDAFIQIIENKLNDANIFSKEITISLISSCILEKKKAFNLRF